MSTTAESVVRRLIEKGFNECNLEVVDVITSPALAEHQNFGPDHAPGAAGVRAVVESLRRAFPDFRLTIEDLVVDGSNVWLRMVATGTNPARSWATRRPAVAMCIDVFDVIRVENGRMVEHGACRTGSARCCKLGLLSPPGAVAA